MSLDTSLGPCREKYWEEMSTDEKVERLGRLVEDMQHTWARLAERVDENSRRCPDHIHVGSEVYYHPSRNIDVAEHFVNRNPLQRRPVESRLGKTESPLNRG